MSINDRISAAPGAPGVYLFKDAAGKIIYVGKARSLADRLMSYVGPQADARHEGLMKEAADVDMITTSSGVEALILEENLIKLNKPRFNVLLKDDKKFPYIKITVQDKFPAMMFTRNVKPDGSAFFGPYTNAKALRRALKAAQRIFQLRSCRKPLSDSGSPQSKIQNPKSKIRERPCLNFSMDRCVGPCQGNLTEAEYRTRVKAVMAFLSGRNAELTTDIEKEMWQASEAGNFERAAELRDQLLALRDTQRRQQVVFGDRKSRDAIGLVLGERTAHAVILKVREGKLVNKSSYQFSIRSRTSESEVLEMMLRSFYGHTYDLPDEILVPHEVEEVEVFEQWFREKRGKNVEVSKPERGARISLLRMAQRNAEREAASDTQVARVPAANLELGKILRMAQPPRRIEGIDISNTQGRQAVGSIVVFSDNRPLKSEYRKFKIKTVTGPDDYAMMGEVLRRRVKRLAAENKPLADLVLVDGGKGQLSTAAQVYQEFGKNVPMLGFAKRTDLVYYIDGREIQIPANSPALRLLKQIRDEAHRFAITFHRLLRGQEMKSSILDDLPGVGKKRKLALIRHFGTLERIRDATVEELRQVPDVGPTLALKLHDSLRE